MSMPRVARAIVFVLVLGLAHTGCTINPVTGKNQLDLLGEGQEIQLGASLYPLYTQSSLGPVDDPQLQGWVQEVGDRLAGVSHRPALDYGFNVVNEPAVNAYALPGGKISFTRGLLSRLGAEDDAAAVLGHEIGHVTARHSAQQYTRQMLAQVILVAGMVYMEAEDVEHRELYTVGGLIGSSLLMARYSRDQERQSDELGLEYMVKSGYNPEGLIRVMEVLSAESQRAPNIVERMFASHPQSRERLETARARVAALPAEVRARPFERARFERLTSGLVKARPAYDRLEEARRLLVDDKPDKALPLLEKSVAEWPDDGLLRGFLAAGFLAGERVGAAMTNATQAAQDAPGIFHVQTVAGQAMLAGKKYDEALRHLDRAGDLMPDQPPIELMRGFALEKLGRKNDAAEAYRQVLALSPDGPEAKRAHEGLARMGMRAP